MAKVISVPDSLHQQLALFRSSTDTVPSYYFWWDASDSLIHAGSTVGGSGSGPMVLSRADRFQFTATNSAVRMDLRLRTASGSTVEVGTLAVFMGERPMISITVAMVLAVNWPPHAPAPGQA